MRQPSRVVGLVWLSLSLIGFVSAASAQSLIFPGVIGEGGRVGDCHGNCGAGCSNRVNPCFNGDGWRFEQLGPPEYVRSYGTEFCADIDGGLYLYYTWDIYRAWGRYTYHGWWSPGCADHDDWCWRDPVRCIAPPDLTHVCDGIRPETWSYEDYAQAQPVLRIRHEGGGCVPDGDPIGPSPPPETRFVNHQAPLHPTCGVSPVDATCRASF